MDGMHDCGGMDGFGPVPYRTTEPVFAQEWEGRALALLTYIHILGISNWDKSRWYRESMGNENYANELKKSYYTHWLSASERLLVDAGVISEEERLERLEEIQDGTYRWSLPTETEEAIARRNENLIDESLAVFRAPHSLHLEGPEPSFGIGDEVLVRVMNPPTHSRCPKYVRGRRGRIVESYGCQIYPDSAAVGKGPDPQPLYTVEFDARELWGDDGHTNDTMYVDLWEPYLATAS